MAKPLREYWTSLCARFTLCLLYELYQTFRTGTLHEDPSSCWFSRRKRKDHGHRKRWRDTRDVLLKCTGLQSCYCFQHMQQIIQGECKRTRSFKMGWVFNPTSRVLVSVVLAGLPSYRIPCWEGILPLCRVARVLIFVKVAPPSCDVVSFSKIYFWLNFMHGRYIFWGIFFNGYNKKNLVKYLKLKKVNIFYK